MIAQDLQAIPEQLEFRCELERHIQAPIQDVFEALLEQLGPANVTMEDNPLSMKIEPHPGGRWYRDLGDGNGHLWAHVQSIKRPTLLELTGPLFMSAAVCNNVQYRLAEADGKTTLRLVHSAFGPVPDPMRDGMPKGWTDQLDRIERRFA
jgi:uncharacterized protein YndB with AHSA1/START domain